MGAGKTALARTCLPNPIKRGSVSDLLSDPQLSRVCGMVLGVWFPLGRGGVAWAFLWKPAPSAAPRAR
jgi:hypothetical protein